jgi:hypothetical protein
VTLTSKNLMYMRSRPHQVFGIIFLASICLLTGCQYDPWADGFLRSQAAEKDLIGTYRINSDTLTRHILIPMTTTELPLNPDAEIVLSADHKVTFFHVSEVNDRTNKSCVVSGAGTWQQVVTRFAVVFVQIQRTDNPAPGDTCGREYNEELNLYGKKPPYKLLITIGDPDSGDVLQFEKVR